MMIPKTIAIMAATKPLITGITNLLIEFWLQCNQTLGICQIIELHPLSWVSYRRNVTLRQLTPAQIGLQEQER